jgi:hypothetical protein
VEEYAVYRHNKTAVFYNGTNSSLSLQIHTQCQYDDYLTLELPAEDLTRPSLDAEYRGCF